MASAVRVLSAGGSDAQLGYTPNGCFVLARRLMLDYIRSDHLPELMKLAVLEQAMRLGGQETV